MSIKSEIDRIEMAKSDIRTAIRDKGQPVADSETVDQYPEHIRAIETGAKINDDEVSPEKTWSSRKINGELAKKANKTDVPTRVSQLTNDSGYVTNQIDDTSPGVKTAFSSAHGNQIYAPTLSNTASGEVVAVDDVSPLEHSVGCKVQRGNAIPYPFKSESGVYAGVTVADNGDGTLTLNGTSTGEFIPFLLIRNYQILPFGKYNLSIGFESTDVVFRGYIGNTLTGDSRIMKTFEIKTSGYQQYYIYFEGVHTYENVIIKPMITPGYTPIPFAPYIPDLSVVTVTRRRADGSDTQDYTNTDGTVSGMTSLSPNMTVLTDTPGALLEVTYNQDPVVIIQNLTKRVADLESKATGI